MTSLLDVKNLNMHFPIRGGLFKRQVGSVYAVNDVSFQLEEGETFGIVGESGCGKSTLGRALVRIYEPTSGDIFFRGQNIAHLKDKGLKDFRKEIQMVFQDPYASLNPRKPIFDILEEPFLLHGLGNAADRRKQVEELMQLVGLRATDMNKFPHEFSGGQRQRIGIARALALRPSLIVCDEAVSALDVSIQAQIINLLMDLQKQLKLTYIFISHDLNVVRYISDRVAVMYLGRLMEVADSATMYKNPAHPYTRALMASAPKPDPRRTMKPAVLEGDVPSPSRPPSGCPFHTRCPYTIAICKEQLPALLPLGNDNQHRVACHRAQELNMEAIHS
ncbi:MAG TPA: dipeptide ABC transporter ATP-binding protein [Oligoflexus sp.]|uniref:ABC transporter ATP-binding protein n=1 Tax=Oligoflexus sp. TaxID=1971216 RepID=UPI002D80E612|nr:dipeptide ABC transporter ATP-binding protein [Oligoflexus sp.]HET9236173.1 dipeptide ABC transporter ATP-binding protein [Oligoflexus sp.]